MRQQGQIRLHNFGLYIDPGLWGQTVDVLMYDDAVRIEQAEQTASEHRLRWCGVNLTLSVGVTPRM